MKDKGILPELMATTNSYNKRSIL